MVAGYSLLAWLVALIVAIVLAVLTYYVLIWLFGVLKLGLPEIIPGLIAVLVFIGVLFGGPRYYPSSRA